MSSTSLVVKVSPVIQRLRENNPALLQLNDGFCQLVTGPASAATGSTPGGGAGPASSEDAAYHGGVSVGSSGPSGGGAGKVARSIRVVSLGEGLPSKLPLGINAVVVPSTSAAPGVGDFTVLPDATHINICKPRDRDDVRYRTALDLVEDVVAEERAQKSSN